MINLWASEELRMYGKFLICEKYMQILTDLTVFVVSLWYAACYWQCFICPYIFCSMIL